MGAADSGTAAGGSGGGGAGAASSTDAVHHGGNGDMPLAVVGTPCEVFSHCGGGGGGGDGGRAGLPGKFYVSDTTGVSGNPTQLPPATWPGGQLAASFTCP
jgi:hypothetical protein